MTAPQMSGREPVEKRPSLLAGLIQHAEQVATQAQRVCELSSEIRNTMFGPRPEAPHNKEGEGGGPGWTGQLRDHLIATREKLSCALEDLEAIKQEL